MNHSNTLPGAIGARRFAVVLFLMAAAFNPGRAQSEAQEPWPPPGFVLVDDMALPESVVYGDGAFVFNFWPSSTVHYTFDSQVSTAHRADFRLALAELEAVSGLNFVEGASTNYFTVRRNAANTNVSNSSVGMQGGQQFINIGDNHWDAPFVMAHEVMHALGFIHEQSRADRNTYVQIRTQYISQTACGGNSCTNNFSIVNAAIVNGTYDFLSIMHYGAFAFTTVEGEPTIVCRPGYESFQDRIGNRSWLSLRDAQTLAALFGSASHPTITGVSPSIAVAGSGPLTLTVGGTGFHNGGDTTDGVSGTQFLWDTTVLESTLFSSTLGEIRIPESLLNSQGTHSITVRNHASAGGAGVGSVTFTITPPPCGSTLRKTGWAVAAVGDVNGDAVPDYAIGIPGADNGNLNQAGRVEVYSGATGALISSLNFTAGNSEFGTSLAAMEDINGDGKMELIIGAPGYSTSAGRIQIRAMPSFALLTDLIGSNVNDQFGSAVADAGDLDGDGDRDFVVGIPGYNGNRGRVEIWSTNGGLMRAHNGVNVVDLFGTAVAAGRDINDDGRPDYVVGTPGYDGAAGSATGRISAYSGLTGGLLFTKEGDAAGDNLGRSVAILPSTTSQSGPAHTVAGAPFGDVNGTNSGYVRIYRGNQTLGAYGTVTTWAGSAAGKRFGWFVGFAGDMDDDGRADVIVTSSEEGVSSGTPTGAGEVEFRSGETGALLHMEFPISFFGPSETGSRFGWSVACLGDINGDARLDYVIGQPYADTPCTNHGDWDLCFPPIPPAVGRILISEVTAATPDAVEITNFGPAAQTLVDARIRWKDGGIYETPPFTITLQPGEIAVIRELVGTLGEVPAGTQVLSILPNVPTTTGDFAVGLVNGNGLVIDEVHVAGSDGLYGQGSLGGKFRGRATNQSDGPIIGSIHAERIGALDSNSGGDWTTHGPRSFGLENGNSGVRGYDPLPRSFVYLNEIDDSPDLVELRNASYLQVDLRNWYLLCSGFQNQAHALVAPTFGSSLPLGLLPAGDYCVLGEGSTAPAEKPAAVPYINVLTTSPSGFPFSTAEYEAALYDSYGRLVDLVRATGHDDNVVHNHPRAPAHWAEFAGGSRRTASGTHVLARQATFPDTNNARDLSGRSVRTMGSDNLALIGGPPAAPPLDVRWHSGRTGTGFTCIVNAGGDNAGSRWSFAFSSPHLQGNGPVLGLGADALANYQLLNSIPGIFGVLDSRGSARLDLPAGTLPPGFTADAIFFLQDPQTFAITALSPILEYDS